MGQTTLQRLYPNMPPQTPTLFLGSLDMQCIDRPDPNTFLFSDFNSDEFPNMKCWYKALFELKCIPRESTMN